jgi:hypothetical protein
MISADCDDWTLDFIKGLDKIVFKCYSKFFNHYFLKMKNTTNTLNKLTKLLAIAIFSVSLNAFSVVLSPIITISTNHVGPAPTAITTVAVSSKK